MDIKVARWVLLALGWLAWAPLLWAQETLIFSTTHDNLAPSQVNERKGEILVRVSSFEEIKQIEAPDGSSVFQVDRFDARLRVPYWIERDATEVEILVHTSAGTRRKRFRLEYAQPEPVPEPKAVDQKPWQVMVLASLASTDNATQLPQADGPIQGTKASLLVAPQWDRAFWQGRLTLQGILLREQYDQRELAAVEVVYSQVKAAYGQALWGGQAAAGISWVQIGTEAQGAGAASLVETDWVAEGQWSGALLPGGQSRLSVEWSEKRDHAPTSVDHDDSGRLLALGGGFTEPKDQWSLELSGEVNQALGDYADYSQAKISGEKNWPFEAGWSLKAQASTQQTEYAAEDPLKGAQESSRLSSLLLSASLPAPGLPGWQALAELQYDAQASNIDDLTYTQTTATFSLATLF